MYVNKHKLLCVLLLIIFYLLSTDFRTGDDCKCWGPIKMLHFLTRHRTGTVVGINNNLAAGCSSEQRVILSVLAGLGRSVFSGTYTCAAFHGNREMLLWCGAVVLGYSNNLKCPLFKQILYNLWKIEDLFGTENQLKLNW